MRAPGLARFPCPSHPTSVFCQPRLTWLDALPHRVDDHQIIGVANHGRGAPAGKRPLQQLFPPVQRNVRDPGRGHAALRGGRGGRRPVARVEDSRRESGVDLPAHGRRGVERASHCRVVDAINACGEVRLQHPCGVLVALAIERSPRLPGAPSRTKATAGGCTRRFPCRFQGVLDDARGGPVRDRRDAQRALLVRAGCGKVDPPDGRRCPVAQQGGSPVKSVRWREGRPTLDAWCLLAWVVVGPLPYRSSLGIMGTAQACLESADLPGITTWRGAVDALLELQYLPRKRRPAAGLPLLHRSACRAHHLGTPTRPSPVHTSGRTSAYPPAFLVAFAA